MNALIPLLLSVLMPQDPGVGKLVDDAKITLADAAERAMREAKTGVVVKAELEFEKDLTCWSFDIAQGDKILEVLLDAKTGKVVERGEEAEDCSAVVKAARFSLVDTVAAVLQQMVGNLVRNAIRYNRPGGHVVVHARALGDNAQIEVEDNGIGVPAAMLSRLGERFFRVDPSRTRDTGGTGLGLSIAIAIAKAHGGTLAVHSIEHRGTRVLVTLPCAGRRVQSQPVSP